MFVSPENTHMEIGELQVLLIVMRKKRAASMSNIKVPPWSIDPNVKNFLRSMDLELEVVADEKYLKGLEDRPLIIVRRAQVQYASP